MIGCSAVWRLKYQSCRQTRSSLSLSNTVLTLLYKTIDFQRNPEEFNWNKLERNKLNNQSFLPRETNYVGHEILAQDSWVDAHYWLIKS